ncbi:MAG: PEGA domain-containing protein [Phycisphaerae bacterium]
MSHIVRLCRRCFRRAAGFSLRGHPHASSQTAGFSLRGATGHWSVASPFESARAKVHGSANPRGLKPAARSGPYPCSLAIALLVAVGLTGCVRRTIRITTEPPHALVFLNDQEIGRSEVTTNFLWYGDYDVIVRKKGYRTLHTHWEIKPPWYQILPIDFFAEVLWPGDIHDVHHSHFVLTPKEVPATDELIERAEEIRRRALDPRK